MKTLQQFQPTLDKHRVGINAFPEPFSYINTQFQYEFVNEKFLDFVGKDKFEVVGKTVSELLGIETAATIKTKLKQVFQGDSVEELINVVDHPGEVKWIRISYVPDFADNGTIKGAFCVERDCSAEQHLRELIEDHEKGWSQSNAHLSIIFNNTSDLVFALKVEITGSLIIQTINKRMADFLTGSGMYKNGYEILGRDFEQEVNSMKTSIDMDLDVVLNKYLSVINERVQKTFETNVLTPKFGLIHFQVTMTPAFGKNEDVQFVLTNIRDITDSVLAKKRLELSEEKLSLILNNTDDIMLLAKVSEGHRYVIESCNDRYNEYGIEHGFFETADQSVGMEVYEMLGNLFNVNREKLDKRRGYWIQCEKERQIVKYKIETRFDNNEFLYHEITLSPIIDKEGNCTHIVSVARDITKQHNALKKLSESEDRYRKIVLDQEELLVRWKKGGIRTFVNNAYCRHFNLTEEEAIGSSFYDLIPADVRNKVIREQEKISWKNPKSEITHQVVNSDGSISWQEWIERAIFDENKNIVEYQSIGRDVTDAINSRLEVEKQKRELKNLIDNVPGIVYRHKLDDLWSLEFVSDASQEITGYTADELVKIRSAKRFVKASELKNVQTRVDVAVATGEIEEIEHELVKKDGSLVWVLNRYKCVYDRNGSPQFIEGVIVDINAQKIAEQKLEKSRGLLSMIYNGTRDELILLEIDALGKFFLVSANIVFKENMRAKGLEPEAYINSEFVYFLTKNLRRTKKFAQNAEQDLIAASISEEPVVTVLDIRDENGHTTYKERTLTAVRNDKGKCTHLLETLRDITAQRIVELELMRNEQRMSLIYNNANDFMALLKVQDVGFKIESVNNIYLSQIHDTMAEKFPLEAVTDMQLSYFLSKGLGLDEGAVDSRMRNFYKAKKSGKELTFLSYRKVPAGDWHRKHHIIPISNNGACTHLLWVSRGINDTVEAERKLKEAFEEVKKLKLQLERENYYLKEEIRLQNNFEDMVFASDSFQNVLTKVEQVAPLNVGVLITGETGTGKELIARAIHNLSDRKGRPMIKLNCGAIPKDLVESELFGHEKGAFTSAFERKTGKFELAHGSSIFLDEIGEMPLDTQVKLLRVLQEGEFERVGGNKVIKVDVRIIAATNRDMSDHVKRKKFRQDLFYRLNVFPMEIPPLRTRIDDIPPLVEYFIQKYSSKHQRVISFLSQDVMDALQSYTWPGNVRELENMIERAVITSINGALEIPELTMFPTRQGRYQNANFVPKTLAEIERTHILKVLKECSWKISGNTGAATILGLKPSTLRDRMKKLKLMRPKIA